MLRAGRDDGIRRISTVWSGCLSLISSCLGMLRAWKPRSEITRPCHGESPDGVRPGRMVKLALGDCRLSFCTEYVKRKSFGSNEGSGSVYHELQSLACQSFVVGISTEYLRYGLFLCRSFGGCSK